MSDPKEDKDDIKCLMCRKQKVQVFLVSDKLPNSERLLCDQCYQNHKGSEDSIRYMNAKREMNEKKQKKRNSRKSICVSQIKSIEKILQILISYKQDLIYELNSTIMGVNEWIRTIQKIEEFHNQSDSFEEIYSLRSPNSIKDQKEVLQFRHLIKHCNLQFCEKLLLNIHNLSNTYKLRCGYQSLIDVLFSIEQNIETNPSELVQLIKKIQCTSHQDPVTKVQYKDSKNPYGIFCNNCENKVGDSLDTFSMDWSTFLRKKEESWKKYNQCLKDKMHQENAQLIESQDKINCRFEQASINLVQIGAIELQKQSNQIEELKKFEQDLNIISMITTMVEFNNSIMINTIQIDQRVTNSNPILQIDTILKGQMEKKSAFLNQELTKIQDLTKYGPIQLRLVSQCQNENCTAIAFNSSKQLMVINEGNKINIYQLNKLNWIKKLQVNKDTIDQSFTCMIHSKFCSAFVTASEKLVIWKYCDNINLCQSQVFNIQNGQINCLIVNKNETQLFGGGQGIQVYLLNFEAYSLKYVYSIQEHQGKVLSLSLNDSETYLISYGEDQKIIVMFKREENWTLMNTLSIQEENNRISFIRNDLFISVTDLKSDTMNGIRISIFKKIQDQFQEQVQEQLQFDYQCQDAIQNLDQPELLIIQFHDQNLIFIKNRNYIYIMRQQLNGKYAILQKPMNFTNSSLFCNTLYIPQKNECYLVIWDQTLKTYQIMF